MMRRLRCFVAMAFGHKDTDRIYNSHIKKAIRAVHMIPIRVDRLIHLDRIDNKIRKEIANAEVVVADLTYARPSVYWEAGFAERKSPVVYTCRSDHLRPKSDDTFGNLQVHFDLRNANIIPWSTTGSLEFERKLTRTLAYASKPLRDKLVSEERKREERQGFAELSQTEKRRQVIDSSTKGLRALGYRVLPKKSHFEIEHFESRLNLVPVFWKQRGSTLLLVSRFPCNDALSKSTLRKLEMGLGGLWRTNEFVTRKLLSSVDKRMTGKPFRAIRRIMLLPVLDSVPLKRLESALPDWLRLGTLMHFSNPTIQLPYSEQDRVFPTSSEFVIIAEINSLQEYRVALEKAFSIAESSNNPIVYPTSTRSVAG